MKLSNLLPQHISQDILHATDRLQKMLSTTVEKKIELYQDHQLKGNKVKATLVDLTFPPSYADTLKNDKSLVTYILKPILAIIDEITDLVLPEVDIDMLCSLLGSNEDIFRKIFRCTRIKVHFCATSFEEILKCLPQVIQHLARSLPTTSSIDCISSAAFVEPKSTHFSQLKKALLKINGGIGLKYNSAMITKGEKIQKTNPRKRSLMDTSGLLAASKSKKQKTEKKSVKKIKKSELIPIPKSIENTLFTFDSFQPITDGSDPFTAYSYWKLESVHKNGCIGAGATVAIVDSGIDPSHPAFYNKGNIAYFRDFSGDENLSPAAGRLSHGTLCAGIACGNYDPQYPECPRGVAPGAKLAIYKIILTEENTASWNSVLKALNDIRTVEGIDIDVVSLSLGALQFRPEIAEAITALVNKGIIVVCAASNHGHKFSQPISYPARLGHTLCIGSHGHHGKPSSFSPVGQQIDFLAPGENVTGPSSAVTSHSIEHGSGTSFAAPAVAGLICLIISYLKLYHPGYLPQFKNQWVMKEILREISTSPGKHSDDSGFGALNPPRFFKQPDRFLNAVLTDIILPSD